MSIKNIERNGRMKSFWSANSRDSIRLIALNSAYALKHFGAPRQTPRPTLSRSWKMRRNILYTTEDCTQSKRLVCLLKGANLSFEEADMRSRESELQLKSMGISDPDSPLLIMDDNPLRFLSSNDINSMADKNLLALVR